MNFLLVNKENRLRSTKVYGTVWQRLSNGKTVNKCLSPIPAYEVTRISLVKGDIT